MREQERVVDHADRRKRMRLWSLGSGVLGCLLVGMTLGAAQPPPSIPGATMSAGQQYFVRYCSACHGMTGRGDGPAAPALRTPPADLTRIAQRLGRRWHLKQFCHTQTLDRRAPGDRLPLPWTACQHARVRTTRGGTSAVSAMSPLCAGTHG